MRKFGFLISFFLIQVGFCVEPFRFGKSDFDIRVDHMKRPKLVDVYTNHPNVKEVENNFFQLHNRKRRQEKMLLHKNSDFSDRKDTLNFQNIENLFSSSKFLENQANKDEYVGQEIDFEHQNPDIIEYVYPKHPPFYTQTHGNSKDNFVFLQSQAIIPDSENYGSFYIPSGAEANRERRPHFWTKQQNFSFDDRLEETSPSPEVVTKPYSYVQKIPSLKKRFSTTTTPSDLNSNRYEEVDLIQEQKGTSKKHINDMVRKYLATLLVEKYGTKINKTDTHRVKTHRKYLASQNEANQKINDHESKLLYTNALWNLKNKTVAKIKQFFSLFTVIKFNNTECNATNWAGSWQGVCLTASECAQQNGTALGNCASGYGVCCVFRGSCGDSSSRNCSYFKSPNYPDFYPANGGVIVPTTTVAPVPAPTPDPRLYWYYYNKGWGDAELDNLITSRQGSSDTTSCVFRVYKTNPNVQQMRIDFVDLDLAGPTNGTCTNERLIITGQNANDQIPVICGYNTGQHVYVDVSQLNGPLQIMVLSATGARKRFKLRICQYTDSCGTSQSNCLQYYTGVSGVIQSFNYDQATTFNRSRPGYFNNLNYAICIRREAGYCSITYSNVRNGQMFPFQMVNVLPNGQLTVPSGQAGVDVLNCPDDYVIIDGTRLCGDRFNDGSSVANFSVNAPVIDTSTGPIVVNVRTNANVTGLGFKLFYMQNPCPTN